MGVEGVEGFEGGVGHYFDGAFASRCEEMEIGRLASWDVVGERGCVGLDWLGLGIESLVYARFGGAVTDGEIG